MKALELPHRRFNPLTGEWVLVSPHRTKRPWQGKVEPTEPAARPAHDPTCYLCPGNERANGERNPLYKDCFVFDNDFAALLPVPNPDALGGVLLRTESISGECRVICFSPGHNLTLPDMDAAAIRRVVDMWAEQTAELGRRYKWVQVFENKGEIMGCSNPHPHGQIWASDSIPNEPAKEDRSQKVFAAETGNVLLLEYLEKEIFARERVVIQNDHWAAVVPFWAVWPYETILLPRRHVARMNDLKSDERDSLSEILRNLLIGYDRLFHVSFPYTMGWHGAPFRDEANSHWQMHAHFYPPLLRSASVRKFMVGYEMLAEPQRDISPESAAEMLRNSVES
ncbi:MAG: UDP-glucose--hexose-1-phosphate uridylyltransferase [Pyrinomonadaceae bacterium]